MATLHYFLVHQLQLLLLLAGIAASVSGERPPSTCPAGAHDFPLLLAKDDGKTNPLLLDWDIPPYDLIRPEHLVPGTTMVVQGLEADLAKLEQEVKPEWSKLVRPLEKINDRLAMFYFVAFNLYRTGVCGSPCSEAMGILGEFESKCAASKPIYEAFKAIRVSPTWPSLNAFQKRVVEIRMRTAELAGIGLSAQDSKQLGEMGKELFDLGNKYDQNKDADSYLLTNLLQSLKQFIALSSDQERYNAMQMKYKGDYRNVDLERALCVKFDKNSTTPYKLMHSCDRSVREKFHLLSVQLSSSGDHNNAAVIEEILKIRWKEAQLLGSKNFAQLHLGDQMEIYKGVLDRLRNLLDDMERPTLEDLKSFIRQVNAAEAEDLKAWDIYFWQSLKEKLDHNHAQLVNVEEYFSLNNALDAIFHIVKRVFDITIEEIDPLAPVWSKDVRFFSVKDSSGNQMGYIYGDFYYRPNKYVASYTSEIVGRSPWYTRNGKSLRLPVFIIFCNFHAPTDAHPTLLEFLAIRNVFHEFGHALQGVLTKQEETIVAGFREIDPSTAEFASTFMTYWCFQRDVVKMMAKHYKTGKPLSDELLDLYMKQASKEQVRDILDDIESASIDMELHSTWSPNGTESIFDIVKRVKTATQLIPPVPQEKSICTTERQLFSGSYGGSKFTYVYSDVLAADAFLAFKEAENDEQALKKVGQRFRETFLAFGGGKATEEVFVDFRGRKPTLDVSTMFGLKGMLPPKKKN